MVSVIVSSSALQAIGGGTADLIPSTELEGCGENRLNSMWLIKRCGSDFGSSVATAIGTKPVPFFRYFAPAFSNNSMTSLSPTFFAHVKGLIPFLSLKFTSALFSIRAFT